MATWTRDQLIAWVQARIDELGAPTGSSPVASPTTIGKELDEAALQICRTAKKQLVYSVGSWHNGICLVKADADGNPDSIIIPLPSDYVRFLRLRLHNWNLPSDEFSSVDSNLFRQQFNRFQRSTINAPNLALIPFHWSYNLTEIDPLGANVDVVYKQAIQAFPAPDNIFGAETEHPFVKDVDLTAIARESAKGLTVWKNTGLAVDKFPVVSEAVIIRETPAENMPGSLVDPMVWLAAGRVLTSLQNLTLAKGAYDNYAFSLNQIKVGLKGEDVPVESRKG